MERARVLVVDDDQSILALVRARLVQGGVACDVARSSEEGLALMQRNLYLVVILDINLPGLSGAQSVASFKSCSPLVQVFMLTGTPSIQQVIECLDRGASDFFAKTGALAELVSSTADALARGTRWSEWLNLRGAAPATVSAR